MSTAALARQIGLEERSEGLSLTVNALTRSLRTDTTRRIASSSSPDSVLVTSACVVPYHPTPDSPTFVLSALSDGTLCVINTTNLSKTYLFDDETATGDGEPTRAETPRSGSRGLDSMTVACIGQGGPDVEVPQRAVVAYVCCDGWIHSSPLNVADVAELKKLHRQEWAKVTEVPACVRAEKEYRVTFVPSQFSSRILVVATGSRPSASNTTDNVCSPSGMTCASTYAAIVGPQAVSNSSAPVSWMAFPVPLGRRAAANTTRTEYLITSCWLTDTTLLCLWSSGVMTVVDAASLEMVTEVSLFDNPRVGFVQAGSIAVSKKGNAALVAILVEDSVLLTFTVQSEFNEVRSPSLKCPRTETRDGAAPPRSLRVSPSPQSFCSEDVRITDICAFYAFSWIVAVTLESGAVIFVDALSMIELCHKALARVAPINRQHHASARSLASQQFTLVQEKPLLLATFDHNTATFSKSH